MKRFFAAVFFILLSGTGSLHASVGDMHNFTCPLCSRYFECRMQITYSVSRQNLDLKPVGVSIIPIPIPKCPDCGLVFNEDLFSPEDIAVLKNYLSKNNIFMKEPGMPNYYYLAREMEILGKHIENIVYFFLSAVWENRDEGKDHQLMFITTEYIDRISIKSEEYETYQLVKLDLLRRSGRFKEAQMVIEEIKANDAIYKGYTIKIVDYQAVLISRNDRKEHALP